MTHPVTEWLRAEGKTVRDLAVIVGVNESTIHRLIHGKSHTSTSLFLKVERATGGSVTQEECFQHWLKAWRLRNPNASNMNHLHSEGVV